MDSGDRNGKLVTVAGIASNDLYPHQVDMLQAFLDAPNRRLIFNAEMGLGKTRTAVACWLALGQPSCIVVCPALVREEWRREFNRVGEKAGIVYHKRATGNLSKLKLQSHVAALSARVRVISYELAEEFKGDTAEFVIVDEVHKLQNAKSGFTKTLKQICGQATAVLGLTGTLIPSQALNLFGTLDAIWPGRFGNEFTFAHRYTNASHNGYGWAYSGTNPAFEEELKHRLAAVSKRVTRTQIIRALPPISVKVRLRVPGEPLPEAQIYITHRRKTAQDLTATPITGDLDFAKRLGLIDLLIAEKKPIYATMHSIEEGINNLGSLRKVVFLELYWRPKTIIQTIGRFSRLGGEPTPVEVTLYVKPGTVDERIAGALESRFAMINNLIVQGAAEEAIAGAFEIDEEKFLEGLNLTFDDAAIFDSLGEWLEGE